MTADRMHLIKQLTQEIVSEDELRSLFESKPHPHAYMGFACTGQLHIGHMIPIRKIVDFLKADCEFTFLIADLHAYLDDNKTPWNMLTSRFEAYKAGVIGVLKAFEAPLDKVNIVRGTDFELNPEYMKDILQMTGDVTLNRAKRAASEVVRFKDDAKLGGFVYPLLQIQDVYALNADIALGGIDQRGIYMLGRDMAERMKRRKYVCVFTPLLPGLTGDKMSASNKASKISLSDDSQTVLKKMKKAFCPAGEKEGNGVLAFFEHVVMPHKEQAKQTITISRPDKFGGDVHFTSYHELEQAYLSGSIHPLDLKETLAAEVNELLKVVQTELSPALMKQAYPDEE